MKEAWESVTVRRIDVITGQKFRCWDSKVDETVRMNQFSNKYCESQSRTWMTWKRFGRHELKPHHRRQHVEGSSCEAIEIPLIYLLKITSSTLKGKVGHAYLTINDVAKQRHGHQRKMQHAFSNISVCNPKWLNSIWLCLSLIVTFTKVSN